MTAVARKQTTASCARWWLGCHANRRKSEGVLFARTDKESLLIVLNAKDEKLWVLNGDQVRRWEAEHRRKLHRWSNDQKQENTPPKFQARREADSTKYRRRIDSACHEAAAQLVNYAARKHFGVIRYNDTVRDYVGQFRWDRLRGLIREKADAKGIAFELVDASGAAVKDTPRRSRQRTTRCKAMPRLTGHRKAEREKGC